MTGLQRAFCDALHADRFAPNLTGDVDGGFAELPFLPKEKLVLGLVSSKEPSHGEIRNSYLVL